MTRLRIPIRVKLMMAFLVMVTGVVGLITFSTAKSFQDDKKAYINGLTSMVTLGMAEEARSTLSGYRERLSLYGSLIAGDETFEDEHQKLTRKLFDEFPELVAVRVETDADEPATAFNVSLLESVGLSREQLIEFRENHPPPWETIRPGQAHVVNSTLGVELPCLTMAFTIEATEQGESEARVIAVLRSESLLQLVARFSAYEQLLIGSDGKVLAHGDLRRLVERTELDLPEEAASTRDQFNASMTLEYSVDGEEMIGGFASVDFGEVLALAQIPRSAAHLASTQIVRRLIAVAVALMLVAIVSGFLFAHRLTRPIEHLSRATRSIARGSFDIAVEVESQDEMGDLAGSFNHMASELQVREVELKEAHAQLVHSEKMAAFGQLGAGIAHEVKNPLAGIMSCAQLAVDDVEPGSRLHEDLVLIEKETRRCKEIIDNLLKFARQEKTAMKPTDVMEVLESSVAIVHHQLELNEVHVEKELADDLPMVYGNANQLQQVFVNLLINAQQAMEGSPGRLQVSSRMAPDGRIELLFTDNGPGIPAEIQDKLFEPFFTTKEAGKGTGLGLSVSFGIIQEHRGQIDLESEVGRGTTFIIRLPALAAEAQAADVSSGKLEPLTV